MPNSASLAYQQLVPALLIPIHDPTGRVATYQLRPDEPRTVKGKTKTRTLKYETPKGSSLTLDVNPLSVDKMGDPTVPLWITEGSKKVDALVSRDLCALGVMGVWGWRGTNPSGGKTALSDWENVALNGRTVYLVFDSDVMTKPEVYAALERLKAFLESRDARVKVVYLPDDGDAKTGIDDYLVGGRSVDDLLKLASDELRPPPDDGVERAGPYLIKDGAIHHERTNRDGKVSVPLCNFTARITAQNERDDGVERTLTFVLEGTLANGQPLPPAEVSAVQFSPMNWSVEAWGTQAVVYAGMGAKDHLRTAIQLRSGNVPRRTTFTHLGWRKVGSQHVYLHAGGAIAPQIIGAAKGIGAGESGSGTAEKAGAPNAPLNLTVDAPESLRGYILPNPPEGDALKVAVKASLKILDLAPDHITVPLLAAVYRAPLGGVDFAEHLAGSTGAGKSELAALIQQHFGAGLDSRNLPGSWSSTANALEGLAFAAKDTLTAVDDFAPEGSSVDIQRYHATAARLFPGTGQRRGSGPNARGRDTQTRQTAARNDPLDRRRHPQRAQHPGSHAHPGTCPRRSRLGARQQRRRSTPLKVFTLPQCPGSSAGSLPTMKTAPLHSSTAMQNTGTLYASAGIVAPLTPGRSSWQLSRPCSPTPSTRARSRKPNTPNSGRALKRA